MASIFRDKKFLIVDDLPDMRALLKDMVQLFGAADIDTAANGKEAVNQMERQAYDIVLCDYNLGEGKDGQQVLEAAKHQQLIGYSTIFIMITAENAAEMVMGAVEYQPDGYLTKPINKDLLRGRLEKLIAKKADLQDIERAIQKNQCSQAIRMCDARLGGAPANATELLKLKANLCLSLGNYAEAAEIYQKALAVRSVPWARLGLGKLRYLTENYLEAREIFQELTEEYKSFMEAYDWLAKALQALGDLDQAQRVLAMAVEMSPKAILRQQALGEIALKNKDLAVAERALKKTIRIGRESVYKAPTHYTKLANTLTKKGSNQEALKILREVRKEFQGDQQASLLAAVTESTVLQGLNREDEAQHALQEAFKLYEGMGGKRTSEITMEMAKACLSLGDTQKGMALMQDLVRNYHEDARIIHEARQAFDELGLEEDGNQLIRSAQNEVVALNNQGVRLVKDEQLAEALELFQRAATAMPANKTIGLNAARAVLAYMQKNGRDEHYLYQARQYMDRVRKVDPNNDTLRKLTAVYRRMAGEAQC